MIGILDPKYHNKLPHKPQHDTIHSNFVSYVLVFSCAITVSAWSVFSRPVRLVKKLSTYASWHLKPITFYKYVLSCKQTNRRMLLK
jgi:hypothetical protein